MAVKKTLTIEDIRNSETYKNVLAELKMTAEQYMDKFGTKTEVTKMAKEKTSEQINAQTARDVAMAEHKKSIEAYRAIVESFKVAREQRKKTLKTLQLAIKEYRKANK